MEKGCPKGLGEPPSYPLLAFDAGVCMQGMQHFVTSGLHLLRWKEFKPFSCCCPFAVEASTWNRNKICNGFKITCFSQIPKNGNSFGNSLWRWGGLGILQRGHLRSLQIASTACSYCRGSSPMPEDSKVTGKQHVNRPKLSDIKTKAYKQSEHLCGLSQNILTVTGGDWLGWDMSLHPPISQ